MVWFTTWSCIDPRCFDEHWRLFFYNDRTRVSACAVGNPVVGDGDRSLEVISIFKLSNHSTIPFLVNHLETLSNLELLLPCLSVWSFDFTKIRSVDARLGKVNEIQLQFFFFRNVLPLWMDWVLLDPISLEAGGVTPCDQHISGWWMRTDVWRCWWLDSILSKSERRAMWDA